MSVGAIVRVPLHGRRVRGWVVADDVASVIDGARLRPLITVSSAGPPAAVVSLCASVAYRCAGPVAALLRSASPPNNVRPNSVIDSARGAIVLRPIAPPRDDLELAADELAATALAAVGHRPAGDGPAGNGPAGDGPTGNGPTVLRWPPFADRRRLVARLLAASGSTIVVTADGSRAAAFQRWLAGQGTRAVLLHSDASPRARTDAWRIAKGGACVVVGGRSAVFAPVPDLACGVLLDDGDEALQEERSPTWHARDVLQERLGAVGAASFVVSPAPTAITLRRARAVFAPSETVERGAWPRVEVVDRRDDPPGTGLLTDRLVAGVQAAVAAGAPAVLVLNRRGGVRLLRCSQCHELTRWAADTGEVPRPKFCEHCGATRLVVLRGGVQRLATELQARIGDATVAVIDGAVALAPEASVLVGTEAVLHRVEVRRRHPSLVAFVDFDSELHAARYRAAEQALWLVVRAAHVLGGRARPGRRVVLQTHDPAHVVVRAAVLGTPQLVSDGELVTREAFGLPPFGALAEVRGDGEALQVAARALQSFAQTHVGVSVDEADQRLLVRADDDADLASALSIALEAGRVSGPLRVSVDPPRL